MNYRKGFTFIELLVVIAIIAILAAILFPVFAKVREKARQTSCLSNEKQLGLAFIQYSEDYDEHYPVGATGGYLTFWGLSWTGRIYPYVKSTGVYHCPDDTTPTTAGDPNSVAVSYNYNASLLFNNGNAAFPGPVGAEAGFNAPSKTVLLNEISGDPVDVTTDNEGALTTGSTYSVGSNGTWAGTENQWGPTNPTVLFETGVLGGRAESAASYIDKANLGRHNNGSNYLLCDGHAKWYPGGAVSSGFSALLPTNPQSSGDDSTYPYAAGTADSSNTYAITFSAT